MTQRTSTRVPEVIDHLITTFRAAVAGQDEQVLVNDGPFLSDRNSGRPILFVGSRGVDQDDEDAVTSDQEWRYIGSRARTEEISVVCSLWVVGGGTDMAGKRDRAFALFDLLAEALRVSIAALSAAGRVTELGVTANGMRGLQSNRGAEVILTFTVSASAIV